MEDYIFILIAIVLSVVGAYNSNKKKQREQLESMEKEVRPSVFDAFEDDDDFFKETTNPIVVPRPAPVKPQPGAYRFTATASPSPVAKEPIKAEVLASKESDEEQQKETTFHDSLLSDFSLKKAVVYSEILNPKY